MEKRPFAPHLTLARVKAPGKLRGLSWEVEMEEVVVGITAVHLIESQLTSQGPIYTTRHTSRLDSA
jgi:2'-5' RNA ligase